MPRAYAYIIYAKLGTVLLFDNYNLLCAANEILNR